MYRYKDLYYIYSEVLSRIVPQLVYATTTDDVDIFDKLIFTRLERPYIWNAIEQYRWKKWRLYQVNNRYRRER